MAWRRSGVRIPIAPLERPCSGPSGPFAGSLFFPGGDPRAPDVRSLALAHLVCGVARRTSEVGGLRPPRRALVLFGGATPVPPCVRSLALAHLVCGVARWARSVFAGSLLFSGGATPRALRCPLAGACARGSAVGSARVADPWPWCSRPKNVFGPLRSPRTCPAPMPTEPQAGGSGIPVQPHRRFAGKLVTGQRCTGHHDLSLGERFRVRYGYDQYQHVDAPHESVQWLLVHIWYNVVFFDDL